MAQLWVVREIEGIEGSFEEYSTIALSFEIVHDYSEDATQLSRNEIKARLRATNQDLDERSIGHAAGQIYRFAHEINEGDYALGPIRETSKVLMGRNVGKYAFNKRYAAGFSLQFSDGYRAHTRRVEWCKTVSRDAFSRQFQRMLRFSEQSVFQPRKCAMKRLEEFLEVLQV